MGTKQPCRRRTLTFICLFRQMDSLQLGRSSLFGAIGKTALTVWYLGNKMAWGRRWNANSAKFPVSSL